MNHVVSVHLNKGKTCVTAGAGSLRKFLLVSWNEFLEYFT